MGVGGESSSAIFCCICKRYLEGKKKVFVEVAVNVTVILTCYFKNNLL